MVWIGNVHCEKFEQDIVARTFALIAPVWRVLHQVSCSSETVQNAPERKEMHQNMSLGSMVWIGSVNCQTSNKTSRYELLY